MASRIDTSIPLLKEDFPMATPALAEEVKQAVMDHTEAIKRYAESIQHDVRTVANIGAIVGRSKALIAVLASLPALSEVGTGKDAATITSLVNFLSDRLMTPDEMKLLREARALLSRLEGGEREGWRPIESAPKDGTPVDLWAQERERYDHERITHCRFVNGNWRHVRTIYDDESDDDTSVVYNPTHWRPLPAAPVKEPTP